MSAIHQYRPAETELQPKDEAWGLPALSGPVCWVLISATPYHDARFSAFASRTLVPPVLLELTDHEPFSCLELPPGAGSYVRRLLRSSLKYDDMTRSNLRSWLFQALDEIGPAVVCVNGWSLPGSLETMAWCDSRGVPAIIFSESTVHDSARSWWKEAIKERLLSFASAVLVGGRAHAEYAIKLGVPNSRIFRGYDAVNNRHFEEGSDEARLDAPALRRKMDLPERYFLTCCRFSQKKNLARLLQAYAMYRSRVGAAAWNLVLAGDGEERLALQELAKVLDIEETVSFIGARGYGELPTLYGLASAFVHASTTEQWGLVVNEAAAAGLPLLVSDRCGCAPELVIPGVTGILFDPYSIEQICDAMVSVAAPETDRAAMGYAARTTAREWSPQRFANGLTQAIRTALEVPSRKPSLIAKLTLRALSGSPLPKG